MPHPAEKVKTIQTAILKELQALSFPEEKISELKKFLVDDQSPVNNQESMIHFRQQAQRLLDTHQDRIPVYQTFSYELILLILGIFLISHSYPELKKEKDAYRWMITVTRMIFGLLISTLSVVFTKNHIAEWPQKINAIENLLVSLDKFIPSKIDIKSMNTAQPQPLMTSSAEHIPQILHHASLTAIQSTLVKKSHMPVKLEEKSITYPYRKLVIGEYLHKIMLFSTLFLNHRPEQENGNTIVQTMSYLLGMAVIKGFAYRIDKYWLEWYMNQEMRKSTEIMERMTDAGQMSYPRVDPSTSVAATCWAGVMTFGPLMLWFTKTASLTDLYHHPSQYFQSLNLFKFILVFIAMGGDSLINRNMIRTNNRCVSQQWDQHQLKMVFKQFEKTASLIRHLFSIALPEIQHEWKQDPLSAYQANTLTYMLPSQFKRNPSHIKLFKSIKVILSHHFPPSFEIQEDSHQLQFSIPYLSKKVIENGVLLAEEIKHLRPLIIRATEIYPPLKDSDWDIYDWKKPENIRQLGILIRRGLVPTPVFQVLKTHFCSEYSPSHHALLLSEVLPVQSPAPQKKNRTSSPSGIDFKPETEKKSSPKNPKRKEKDIADKIAVITQLIPENVIITPLKDYRTCFRVKMSIDQLQEKLRCLTGASLHKSGNGASLLIRFEEDIEIRLIGEANKPHKKISPSVQSNPSKRHPFRKEIKGISPIEPDEEYFQILPDSDIVTDQSDHKTAITIVYSGRECVPIREPLSDKALQGILDAIAEKLSAVTGKAYHFSNPKAKAYILLSKFIKLSYIIKTLYDDLIVRSFGGIWRCLLMAEDLDNILDLNNDNDIVVVIPAGFDVEKNLFEKLKQLGIISEYTKSNKPDIDLYTVPFLNTMHEITIFKNPTVEAHARTLNYNCNIFSLEILRFYFPLVEFYTPLNSLPFVQAIQNMKTPVIESVIHPECHVFLLKESNIQARMIEILTIISPHQKSSLMIAVIEKLIKNPKKYEAIRAAQLTLHILVLLTYFYDPKRIFNLFTLYQSNYYHISKIHQDMISYFLIPKIFNTLITFEEKPVYPNIPRKRLFQYFREYLIKSHSRSRLQNPLLSDLVLLKIIMIAGIRLNIQAMISINKLFDEAKYMDNDTQIQTYLSNGLHSLAAHKQETAAIELFLTAITLTRTSEIFSSIHQVHCDRETFKQCYLLPTFKKKRTEIAGLFRYDPQEPDLTPEILLNKWRTYSTERQASNLYRLIGQDLKNTPGTSKAENNIHFITQSH